MLEHHASSASSLLSSTPTIFRLLIRSALRSPRASRQSSSPLTHADLLEMCRKYDKDHSEVMELDEWVEFMKVSRPAFYSTLTLTLTVHEGQ